MGVKKPVSDIEIRVLHSLNGDYANQNDGTKAVRDAAEKLVKKGYVKRAEMGRGKYTYTLTGTGKVLIDNFEKPAPASCPGNSVDHPAHYGGAEDPYEAIKVIEAWKLGFCLGNTVKYINRAGRKGNRLEDLKKARWYLDREIQNEEKKNG